MKVLKGVLQEELKNSKRIKKQYAKVLKKLPKGSLYERELRGHKYFYIVVRENGKVENKYVGRKEDVSQEMIEKYAEAKRLRALYRNLKSEANKEIALLERILNGKELQSV